MNLGPFEGKSPLEQARAVARAVMGVGPDALNLGVQAELDLAAYAAEHGPITGRWVRYRRAGAPDFFVRSSTEEGLRCDALPPGETPVVTIDARGSRVVTTWLAAFTDAYGRGVYGTPDPVELARLHGALDACRPDFHKNMFMQFWLKLREALPSAAARDPKMVANPPGVADHLYEYLLDVRQLYLGYMVTARLFGSLAAVNDIGEATAARGGEDASDWPPKLASLAAGGWEEPRDLVRAVISVSAEEGFLAQLVSVGERWRDDLNTQIAAARDAPDAETAIEILYEKSPKAWAAVTLYTVLSDAPPSLASDRDRAGWRRVANLVEEKRTRLRHALTHSVLDLTGARWRAYRRELDKIREAEGEAAAARVGRRYVEDHLLYPRVLLPRLLAGDTEDTAEAAPLFPPMPMANST